MQKIPLRSKLLVLTAVMASLLEIIDTSIVNVAVPSMMGNLGTTLDEISWVITGYIIANAIILPIASWMSDQIGRKVYYTVCIALFTASSVACGFAPNLAFLVVFRVLQGLAGGALLPTSQALIYEAFPKEQAGMASAIYGMSVMIGPTVGPTLGGYLTDNFGWRSIFNINLPLGIIVMVLSFLFVEDVGVDPVAKKALAKEQPKALREKRKRSPVDSIGLTLLVTGIGSMQYVLERGHAEDWFQSTSILICTFLAVVCISGLIYWELKTEHPILELRHFKNVNFRSGVFLMAGLGAMLYGLLFLVPVFSTSILGMTATQVGMIFIPGALAAAFMMPLIGKQLQKRDPRTLIFIGVVSLSISFLSIARFDSQTSTSSMFWPLLLRGIAMSFLFVPINTSVLSQFSGKAIGEAAGMLNLCRQLGGSIGIAMLSTLFQQYQVYNFSILSEHLTVFDAPARMASHLFTAGLHAKMSSVVGMGDLSEGALKMLFFKVKKEAFILSFQKAMVVLVVCFTLVLIPLSQMRKAVFKGKLPDAH